METGLYDGLKIIDTDTHWCEATRHLDAARAAKKYADLVPQVRDNGQGGKGWILPGPADVARWVRPAPAATSTASGFKMPPWGWKKMEDDQDMLANTPPLDFVDAGVAGTRWRAGRDDGRAGHLGRDRLPEPAPVRHGSPGPVRGPAARERLHLRCTTTPAPSSRPRGRAHSSRWRRSRSGTSRRRSRRRERITSMDIRGRGSCRASPTRAAYPIPPDLSWDPLYEALSDLDLPINIHIGRERRLRHLRRHVEAEGSQRPLGYGP